MRGKVKEPLKRKHRYFLPAILIPLLVFVGAAYFLNAKKASNSMDISAITIFPFSIQSGHPDI